MPMRVECRHYESRTYANGEVVRKCDLDAAPEAPWRCPDDCALYERRTDIAWEWGRGVDGSKTPPEPQGEGIAERLDAAEELVHAAGPDILREVHAEQASTKKGWKRFFRRR
jgi:hypothetical protein